MAGRMALVGEGLPSGCEALSPNPSALNKEVNKQSWGNILKRITRHAKRNRRNWICCYLGSLNLHLLICEMGEWHEVLWLINPEILYGGGKVGKSEPQAKQSPHTCPAQSRIIFSELGKAEC
jgi:hypothetical protein